MERGGPTAPPWGPPAPCREEGLDASSTAVCELAALLHDVEDYKYSGDEGACARSVEV